MAVTSAYTRSHYPEEEEEEGKDRSSSPRLEGEECVFFQAIHLLWFILGGNGWKTHSPRPPPVWEVIDYGLEEQLLLLVL